MWSHVFLEHSVDRTVREAVVHFVNLSYLKYLKQCESYVRNTAGLFCSEQVYARNVTLADLQGNYIAMTRTPEILNHYRRARRGA